jgi:DNA-binding NarL/FixJ family response regulator
MKKITVLLAEDHQVVREGLRQLLEHDADLAVVGEAQDGRQAVEMAGRLRPDVILMDIAMPQLNGLGATQQILKILPSTRIIILSAYNEDAYISSATEAGAVGYLLKQSSVREVCDGIRAVMDGRTYFSKPITNRLVKPGEMTTGAGGRQLPKRIALTARENEVLQLVAEGKANKATAAALGICIKTVEKHREHLMNKLGIHDTAGLTRYAIGAGIIESPVQVTIL